MPKTTYILQKELTANVFVLFYVNPKKIPTLPPPPPSELIRRVIHMQEITHEVPKPASHTVISRMQLTLHATRRTPVGASRLV